MRRVCVGLWIVTMKMQTAKCWHRRILSAVSLMAFGLALYFSFQSLEHAVPMAGMWLVFCVFSFVFAWPETIKSISFLGSRIEFLERQVKTLSNLLENYWSRVRRAHEKVQRDIGLAVPVDTEATFMQLDKQLDGDIESFRETAEAVAEKLNGIWDEILLFLKGNGINTESIEAVPYYENPLFSPYWEAINIGMPNKLLYLNRMATQMAIKHYEQMLDANIELSADENERFMALQKRFETYARSIVVD